MRRLILTAAFAAICIPVATAQWSDTFDSYAAGSQVVGQGGWEEWGPGAGALVSSAQSLTPGNSIDILGGTDLVHQYSKTSGQWIFRAMQYVPSTLTGTSYFIMLNTYAYPAGPYSWSMQMRIDAATGTVFQNCGGSASISMPYVADKWVEVKVFIDLDNDWCKLYYNGTLFDDPAVPDHPTLGGGYTWSLGDGGGNTTGQAAFGALDLFANNASSVYYDDISLMPATSSALWFDDIDSYGAGTQIVGQGYWDEWGAGAGSLVSDAQARTAPNSIDVNGGADLVRQYFGYDSGAWSYKTYQYIPSTMSGLTYFIMLNTYDGATASYDWSVQVGFDSTTGNVQANVGSGTAITVPYVVDAWAEIEVKIYLDDDWCQFFYDGTLLDDPAVADHPVLGGGYAWAGGVFGGGTTGVLNIGAVDLYANGASPVYYDDFSLTELGSWHDNFDGYANGSQVVGQGGWEEWGAGAGALVSNAQSYSSDHSIDIAGGTDLVKQYSKTSGRWIFRTMQYVPSTLTGTSYFIMLNTYAYPAGPYSWSMQMRIDAATGTVFQNCGGSTSISMPYVADEWKEIKVVIDLDNDWVQLYYDGNLFDDPAVADHPTLGGGYTWSLGDGGGNTTGQAAFGALDLFANNASSVYYDDISLTPSTDLARDTDRIKVTGGTFNLTLDATTANANRFYLLLGSNSGTTPGVPIGTLILPLNYDWLMDTMLIYPNSTMFVNSFATLDANGMASSSVVIPVFPLSAGLRMDFAYFLLTPGVPYDTVSTPQSFTMVL